MSKTTESLVLNFLKQRILNDASCWKPSKLLPDSTFMVLIAEATQDFSKPQVKFQPKEQGLAYFDEVSSVEFVHPCENLIQKWMKAIGSSHDVSTLMLNQLGNIITTDHRRRHGPKSKPKQRYLKKATEFLLEGIQNKGFPHWHKTFVIGPMLKKPIKMSKPFKNFPEIPSILFRPFNPLDSGSHFLLPWDEYRLRRIPDYLPPASLVIEYSWCEPPLNWFPTSPRKTLTESIRAQKFNQLFMKLMPVIADGDIMARLTDTGFCSGGPNYTPESRSSKYSIISQHQILDFLNLVDLCHELDKDTDPLVKEDWTLISNAIQTLTDSRFSQIGMHSRFALAISCIEALLCKSGEGVPKEVLASRCSNTLSLINHPKRKVESDIIKAYKVRSKFVHGHRSVAQKLASDHDLLVLIEGYARRLIVMTCFLSIHLRKGKFKKKYRKFKLQTVLKTLKCNQELQKQLNKYYRQKNNKIIKILAKA